MERAGAKKKKIIWAPHHSLEDCGGLQLSTFLSYYKFFFELAQKYFNDIQIVFKPHPLLKEKLYQHPDWGKEKRTHTIKNGTATRIHNSSKMIILIYLKHRMLLFTIVAHSLPNIYIHKSRACI